MQKALKTLLIGTVLACAQAFGSEAQLDEALKPLQKAKGLKAQVERHIALAIMDSKKTESGFLTVAGKKMRLEIQKPQKSLLVVKGADVWLEVHPDPELGGKLQVSHGKLNTSKDSQIFVGLLGGDNWQNHFTLKSAVKNRDEIVYALQPKKDLPELKSARLVMAADNKRLKSVEYTDELENKTQYIFASVEYLTATPTKLFEYKPPKNVSVMELN
jgi:outer membrane lipoprotein-sorting protein